MQTSNSDPCDSLDLSF